MKAKKSANSKVPSRALHAKSRKDSCTHNVHPDVILDADEALRYLLGDEILTEPLDMEDLVKETHESEACKVPFSPVFRLRCGSPWIAHQVC